MDMTTVADIPTPYYSEVPLERGAKVPVVGSRDTRDTRVLLSGRQHPTSARKHPPFHHQGRQTESERERRGRERKYHYPTVQPSDSENSKNNRTETTAAAAMPPRLVRRQPLPERISAWLNPLDLLLHISTWFSSFDWDGVQYSLATPMGIFLNLVCFIARASSDNNGRRRGAGDVLRRGAGGTSLDGWGAAISYSVCVSSSASTGEGDTFLCHPLDQLDDEGSLCYFFARQLYVLSWGLALGSLFNTIYCFSRKRAYRLFENNINVIKPNVPAGLLCIRADLPSRLHRKHHLLAACVWTPLQAILLFGSLATLLNPSLTSRNLASIQLRHGTYGKSQFGTQRPSPSAFSLYSPQHTLPSTSSRSPSHQARHTTLYSPAIQCHLRLTLTRPS